MTGRRGRRGTGQKRTTSVADVSQKWQQLLETLSTVTPRPSVTPLTAELSQSGETKLTTGESLQEISDLPLQTIERSAKEAEADLLLIGGHLSLVGWMGTDQTSQTEDSTEESITELSSAFCRIIAKLLGRPDASLSIIGFKDLVRLILEWIELSVESNGNRQVTIESTKALTAILGCFHSQVRHPYFWEQLSVHVLTAILTKCHYSTSSGNYSRDGGRLAESVELCHVASDAIHALYSSKTDRPRASVEAALDVLIEVLSREKPIESPFLAGMYASLLRTMALLVSEGSGCHVRHVPSLVEIISSFLSHGAQSSLPVSSSSDVSSEGSGRYVPPHRQGSSRSGYSSTSSSAFSGSDASGSSRMSDQLKTAKIRLGALTLVQRMSQVDGKSLHPYWTVLFPLRQPLQRSPSTAHLVNVLLYDPHPQVRMTAAGTIAVLLEGRSQKRYLSMAKFSDRDSLAIRTFTSLSISLGRMFVALHDGLLHGIENEDKLSVIPHLFRTLNSLITATPYDRMQSELRTRIARSIRKQWTIYHDPADGDVSRETACLIALRSIIGAGTRNPLFEQYLDERSAPAHERSCLSDAVQAFFGHQHQGWSLMDALIAVACSPRETVRSEATAALTCAATNYGRLFTGRWQDVATILEKNIHPGEMEQSGIDEKASQQAVRLFGALVADSDLMRDPLILEQAAEAVSRHIVPCTTHTSAAMRSAALTEIGGAARFFLASLSADVVQKLSESALRAALEDPVVAVRSSACRMIGDMVNAGFYLSDRETFTEIINALGVCLKNRTISVRISASWSLANLADAIARHPDGLQHMSMESIYVRPLADAAIQASRDHEKVRANGIRALGHLLRETRFSDSEDSVMWLNDAIGCLQSSLKEGTAKVKWNACYAIGSLASNPTLQDRVNSDGNLTVLIGLLAHLIRENPNFKVQMQAAAALENISARSAFQDEFHSAISAVSRRLHFLQSGSQMPLEETPEPEPEPSQQDDSAIANLKYHEGLKHQLEITLLHLLSLLDAPFSDHCDFPRPGWLFSWMKKRVNEVCEQETDSLAHLQSVLQKLSEYEGGLGDWNQCLTGLNAQ